MTPSNAGLDAVQNLKASSWLLSQEPSQFPSSHRQPIRASLGFLITTISSFPRFNPISLSLRALFDLPILPMKVCLRRKDHIYFQRVEVFRPYYIVSRMCDDRELSLLHSTSLLVDSYNDYL
jgi:hypothetical protein